MARKLVRVQYGLREIDSPYEVDESRAKTFLTSGVSIVERYTGGRIAVEGIKRVKSTGLTNPLDPRRVNFPGMHHALLFTGRDFISDDLPKDTAAVLAGARGMTEIGELCVRKFDGTRVISSKTLVRPHSPNIDPYGSYTLTRVVHGLGHSFGLEHCVGSPCVMSVASYVDPRQPAAAIASGEPFCADHQEELFIAGSQALAAGLRADAGRDS